MLPVTWPHAIVVNLLIVIIVTAGWFVWFYNRMINNKIEIENCREEINMLFNQRVDLMIKLAKTVTLSCRGSCRQEGLHRLKETDYSFMNLETAERVAESNMGMEKFIEGLLSIIRRYPEINENEDFLEFQNQMLKLEQKLDVTLQRYNHYVQIYNKFLTVFPNNIVAAILGVKELALF